ncbi:hypothetical protein JCM8115_004274 [Rhodotorula mucilaginosa]|nr:hypothetical protein B0A53_06387 [Rhodotorula sp. CCFEE 5036]
MAIIRAPPASEPLDHLSVGDLEQLLDPVTTKSGKALTFRNWATTFRSDATAVFRPTSVQQVRYAVELARRQKRTIRAAGAGHSPSDIVCTGGYILDLKGLDKVIAVDGDAMTFHAEGGILLRNLHPIILERGDLALSSLGSISDQTLAGALSTSTHGSGVVYSSISTYATFLDIVLPLPNAPVVRVSRQADQDPDLFYSALCGLGAVGIVVGVGMRAERAFKLEEELFTMRFDEFTARWQEIAESSEHVRCWWYPQVARVKISRLNRTDKAVTPRPSAVVSYLQNVVLAKHIHAIVLSAARYFPSLLPYHAWFMWTFREQPGPVRWREFFAGVWARLSGSATGGPWPRISELDQKARMPAGDKEDESEDSDGDSSSLVGESAISNLPFRPVNPSTLPQIDATLEKVADESEHGKLKQPADVLTPPYTPATQSPTGASAPVRPESPSSEIELPGSVLAEEEKHEAGSVGRRAKAANLLWPILEKEPSYRVDWGVNIFNYDCGFPQYTYESCIPYEATGAALNELHRWHTHELAKPGYPLRAHFPVEIRYAAKDEAWLSPTGSGPGCYLGAIQYRPFNLPVPYRDHFARFSSILFSLFSGKPHWAKTHTLTPADLRKLYPRFDDFLAVRERVDPEQILANEYVKRHLLGEVPPAQMAQQGRRWKERA